MSKYEVRSENNVPEFLAALEQATFNALEGIGAEIEAKAKRTTPVGQVSGGKTKNSWKHKVDMGKNQVAIGNTEETAVWLELGTGDYALNGDGRKGGWYIPIGNGKGMISQEVVDAYHFKVVHGKDGMTYAFTHGMKPKRILHNAVEKSKSFIEKTLDSKLGGLGK